MIIDAKLPKLIESFNGKVVLHADLVEKFGVECSRCGRFGDHIRIRSVEVSNADDCSLFQPRLCDACMEDFWIMINNWMEECEDI